MPISFLNAKSLSRAKAVQIQEYRLIWPLECRSCGPANGMHEHNIITVFCGIEMHIRNADVSLLAL